MPCVAAKPSTMLETELASGMQDAAGSAGSAKVVEVNGTEGSASEVQPRLPCAAFSTMSIPERLPEFECTLAIMEHTESCEALMQKIHHQYNLLGRTEISCKDFRKSRIPQAHFDTDAREAYGRAIRGQLRLAKSINDLTKIFIAIRKQRRKLKLLLSTTHRMNLKKNAEEEEEVNGRSRCVLAEIIVRTQDLLNVDAEPVEDRV